MTSENPPRSVTHVEHFAISKAPLLAAMASSIVGFVFSLWYVDAYYLGDAVGYTRFYNSLYEAPVEAWAALQRGYIGSSEPLYRYLIGAGAYFGLERTIYISIWNSIFIGCIGYTLVKYRSSCIFILLTFSNYYVIVLLGSAERLKFSYLFLVAAFCVDNKKAKLFFAACSPFFHAQAAIQFLSGLLYYFSANIARFARTPLRSYTIILLFALISMLFAYFLFSSVGEVLESKSSIYIEQSGGVLEAIQWVMIFFIGWAIFRPRVPFIVSMLPMGVLTIAFGNRVNVATLALFVALAIVQNKTRHPAILAVMAYMSFKSIPFLLDVAAYGSGYE